MSWDTMQDQMQQGMLGNSLGQYQQSMLNNSLSQYQNMVGQLADNCLGVPIQQPTNPYLSPERLRSLSDDGNNIVAKIAFWREIPALGTLVANRLADRLDKISDRIEELA